MVLQVETTYKTKNSNTYSTVAEFVAEHGPCGRDNLEHIQEQGTAVLVGNDSMKVTVKYNNDNELFSLLEKKLFPAVVGDVLDQMGYLHQFLPAEI